MENVVPDGGQIRESTPEPTPAIIDPEQHRDYKLIERFAPPSVIVTRDHEIVHMSENAGQFLHFAGGEPSVNLLRVVHPMLRIELRAALFRAAQANSPAETFRVPVEMNGRALSVDIRVCACGMHRFPLISLLVTGGFH